MPMLSFRISDDLAARVDAAAAGNRSAWIKQALERALGERPVSTASDTGLSPEDRAAAFRRAEFLRRAGK